MTRDVCNQPLTSFANLSSFALVAALMLSKYPIRSVKDASTVFACIVVASALAHGLYCYVISAVADRLLVMLG